jgi:hypothetical protein
MAGAQVLGTVDTGDATLGLEYGDPLTKQALPSANGFGISVR